MGMPKTQGAPKSNVWWWQCQFFEQTYNDQPLPMRCSFDAFYPPNRRAHWVWLKVGYPKMWWWIIKFHSAIAIFRYPRLSNRPIGGLFNTIHPHPMSQIRRGFRKWSNHQSIQVIRPWLRKQPCWLGMTWVDVPFQETCGFVKILYFTWFSHDFTWFHMI